MSGYSISAATGGFSDSDSSEDYTETSPHSITKYDSYPINSTTLRQNDSGYSINNTIEDSSSESEEQGDNIGYGTPENHRKIENTASDSDQDESKVISSKDSLYGKSAELRHDLTDNIESAASMYEVSRDLELESEESEEELYKEKIFSYEVFSSKKENLDNEEDKKKRKTTNTTGARINWAGHFQELLSMPDNLEKFKSLANLAKDFTSVAQAYGKIIISECFLPDSEKTLKPVSLGGLAGGKKYIFQGILFKFALDVPLNDTVWMYGGNKPNNEKAMKAAAHERKGLINLFHCHLPGFHCPLMQLIHYKGFCLTAMALLPIDKSTICYGSSDGGLSVKADSYVSKAMEYAGKILNLKKHKVKNKTIIGPGDIEIHIQKGQEKGQVGASYYFVDCARVFPPEFLNKKKDVRAIFYNLLRPEFVVNYKQPLCSDALSNWCTDHDEKLEAALEIKKATKKLFNEVIPKFVDNFTSRPVEGKKLIDSLHASGINIRHLGRVRHCILQLYEILQQSSVTQPSSKETLAEAPEEEKPIPNSLSPTVGTKNSNSTTDSQSSTVTPSSIPSTPPPRPTSNAPKLSHSSKNVNSSPSSTVDNNPDTSNLRQMFANKKSSSTATVSSSSVSSTPTTKSAFSLKSIISPIKKSDTTVDHTAGDEQQEKKKSKDTTNPISQSPSLPTKTVSLDYKLSNRSRRLLPLAIPVSNTDRATSSSPPSTLSNLSESSYDNASTTSSDLGYETSSMKSSSSSYDNLATTSYDNQSSTTDTKSQLNYDSSSTSSASSGYENQSHAPSSDLGYDSSQNTQSDSKCTTTSTSTSTSSEVVNHSNNNNDTIIGFHARSINRTSTSLQVRELIDVMIPLREKVNRLSVVKRKAANQTVLETSLRFILTECVARVIKNQIRAKLRRVMKTVKIATESPYLNTVYQYLAPIIWYNPPSPSSMVPSDTLKNLLIANKHISTTLKSFYMELTIHATNRTSGYFGLVPQSFASQLNSNNIRNCVESFCLCMDGTVIEAGSDTTYATPIPDTTECVVGLFYCSSSKVVIFTLNGKSLGVLLSVTSNVFVPVLYGANVIDVNFGNDLENRPYSFDIDSFCVGMHYPLPHEPHPLQTAHKLFWNHKLKKQLTQKFEKILGHDEKIDTVSLRDKIDMQYMLIRLQELSGIIISPKIIQDTGDQSLHVELKLTDIFDIQPRVSHLQIIDFAEGVSELLLIEKEGLTDIETQKSKLMSAEAKIKDGIGSSLDPNYSYYYGNCFFQLSMRCTGKQQLEYLVKAEKYFSYNEKAQKLYLFPDLDDQHRESYLNSLNKLNFKSRFKEGLIVLFKMIATRAPTKLLEYLPVSNVLSQAADKIKLVFQSEDGRSHCLKFMKKLEFEIYGSNSNETIKILLQSQAIKLASEKAEYPGNEFAILATCIIHKSLGILASKKTSNVLSLSFDNVYCYNILSHEAQNYIILIERDPFIVEQYLFNLFQGGIVASDLAVLLELCQRVKTLPNLVESVLNKLFTTKTDRSIEMITPGIIPLLSSVKMLREMPLLSKFLQSSTKPTNQKERLEQIEGIIKFFQKYKDELRRIVYLKSACTWMENTLYLKLFNIQDNMPDMYTIATRWFDQFSELKKSHSNHCATIIHNMIVFEKEFWKVYTGVGGQLEVLEDIKDNTIIMPPEWEEALLEIKEDEDDKSIRLSQLHRKKKTPVSIDELHDVINSPNSMHNKLLWLVGELINCTPKEHVDYEPLEQVKNELAKFTIFLDEKRKEAEELRMLEKLNHHYINLPPEIHHLNKTPYYAGEMEWLKPNVDVKRLQTSPNLFSSMNQLSNLPWKLGYCVLYNDLMIITTKKTKELKGKISENYALRYKFHIEISKVTEVADQTLRGIMGFSVKTSNKTTYYFRTTTENHVNWIVKLNQLLGNQGSHM
eukprot:TRINITY_DN626_c0_g1_i2.p1 TRINITY_DN626_c0_g1~~TRINITY_DN626_c0_g1_i2.p1  ORF type:complete len:1906 (-),score=451.08 TRINITY_DN626_c0_g1_i2:60-5777(-)